MGIKFHQCFVCVFFLCIFFCYSLPKGSKGNGLGTGNFRVSEGTLGSLPE